MPAKRASRAKRPPRPTPSHRDKQAQRGRPAQPSKPTNSPAETGPPTQDSPPLRAFQPARLAQPGTAAHIVPVYSDQLFVRARQSPRPATVGGLAPGIAARPSTGERSGQGAEAGPAVQPAGTGGTIQVAEPARRPILAADMPVGGAVQVMSWSCDSLRTADPQGLGLTYWFDAAPTGDPYPVSVRFTGRRSAGSGDSNALETFEAVRTVERVTPGSGRVALTARISGVAPGEWAVTATPVVLHESGDSGSPLIPPPGPLPRGTATGTTAFLPVVNVRAPGVRVGAWPSLVGIGFIVALIVAGLLAAQRGLPVGRLLVISLVASLMGLVGAKVYYLLTHRVEKPSPLTAGMSIQGFAIAAISSLLVGGWWAGLPLGQMLDVTAPGLLFGMTIGRLGCFFGGCCVGRPTASRWGVWSSDRCIGVRRIPVQLLESSVAGVVATSTLVAVAAFDPAVDGLLFLVGFSTYTFARQLLFPLRGIPRKTSHGRIATEIVTGVVIVAAVTVLLVG